MEQFGVSNDVVLLVLKKCSIDTVLRLLPYNKYLFTFLRQEYFWTEYFFSRSDPQLFYHQSMLWLAEHNMIDYFKVFWRMKLGRRHLPPLIKEHRTLIEGFEKAYFNNADLGWEVYRLDMNWLLGYYRNQVLPTRDSQVLSYYMRLRKAARKADINAYDITMINLNAIIDEHPSLGASDTEPISINALAESNDYRFLRKQTKNFAPIELAIRLLTEGKYELVKELIDNNELLAEEWEDLDWGYLIVSKRKDSLELVRKMELEFELSDITETSIGNAEYLQQYAQLPNKNRSIVLHSYRTLPTNEFIALIINTLQCLTSNELEYYKELYIDNGYDYLSQQLSLVPTC